MCDRVINFKVEVESLEFHKERTQSMKENAAGNEKIQFLHLEDSSPKVIAAAKEYRISLKRLDKDNRVKLLMQKKIAKKDYAYNSFYQFLTEFADRKK